MPKPLRTAPPSSAIARLLEGNTAVCAVESPAFPVRAITTVPGSIVPARRSDLRTGGPASVKRELVLTPIADQTLAGVVAVFREATGANLTHSHVARAILRMIGDRLPAIRARAADLPACRLPSNAPGYEGDRDRLEQALAEAMALAMADAHRAPIA